MEKFAMGDLLSRLHNRSGMCRDCGEAVEMIRVEGMTPFCPPVCGSCVEADAAKAVQARKIERLRTWFATTGFARAAYDAARTKGVKMPHALSEDVSGEMPWSLHIGDASTGKTTALLLWSVRQARLALRHDVESRLPAIRYTTEQAAFRALSGKQRDTIADDWRACDVLIIDNCGALAATERESAHLASILSDRADTRSQVALITRHDVAKLIDSQDAPLWSVTLLQKLFALTGEGRNVHGYETAHSSASVDDMLLAMGGGQ